MRKVILDTIISLYRYYTSLNNEIDWFGFSKEEIEWSKEILRRVDTMLYGRVTYQEFSEFWPKASPTPEGFDPEIIGELNNLKKVVFSSSIKDVPWGPAVLIRENPVEAVSRFKKENLLRPFNFLFAETKPVNFIIQACIITIQRNYCIKDNLSHTVTANVIMT